MSRKVVAIFFQGKGEGSELRKEMEILLNFRLQEGANWGSQHNRATQESCFPMSIQG